MAQDPIERHAANQLSGNTGIAGRLFTILRNKQQIKQNVDGGNTKPFPSMSSAIFAIIILLPAAVGATINLGLDILALRKKEVPSNMASF